MDYNLIEDFVADETFQHYCTGRYKEDVQYWEDWIRENPEKKGKMDEAVRLYLMLNGKLDKKIYYKHKIRFNSRVYGTIAQDLDTIRPKKNKNWNFVYSAAAVLLILSAVLFVYHLAKDVSDNSGLVYQSEPGEKRIIHLPDGTLVTLNNVSKITLDKEFGVKNRKITLVGEAYFDVAHIDSLPLYVYTDKLVVKDLGTRFNVKSFPDELKDEAVLIEGIIEVSRADNPKEALVLKPMEKVVYQMNDDVKEHPKVNRYNNSLIVLPVSQDINTNTIRETEWIENRLTFENELFFDITKKLEKWYNVDFVFESEDLKKIKFVGSFKDKNLDQILQALQMASQFNYRKEGQTIVIY